VIQPETPPLPADWLTRASRVEIGAATIRGREQTITAVFPEIHDLTASKVVLGRNADRLFLEAVVRGGLVDRETMLARIGTTRAAEAARESARRDVECAFDEVRKPDPEADA
jgi:hypothetical protein